MVSLRRGSIRWLAPLITLAILGLVGLSVHSLVVQVPPATSIPTSSGQVFILQSIDKATFANTLAQASWGSTITFARGLTGVIPWDNSVVDKNLTINGPGPKSDAISLSFYSLDLKNGVTLKLNDLSIVNIDNIQPTRIPWSTQTTGSAIRNEGGVLVITNSTIEGSSDFNGAIDNEGGQVNIENSTFQNTYGVMAVALTNQKGTVEITNSTFEYNQGGLTSILYNWPDSRLTVTNSTFVTYTRTPVILNAGTAFVVNSLIWDRGYTLASWRFQQSIDSDDKATTTLKNTIFAGYLGVALCNGNVKVHTSLLDHVLPCEDVQPSHLSLGPLADNGGATKTFALLSPNAAINAGDPSYCPATDQRYVLRTYGCDAGAYTLDGYSATSLPTITVSTFQQ